MAVQNKKQVKQKPARTKVASQAELGMSLASLSEKELMRRLQKRLSKAAPSVADRLPSVHSEPETVAVRKQREAIVARARKATGVSAQDVVINLAVQAAVNPAGDYVGGDPERQRELVSIAVETLDEIKPEGALQSMLAVQMIGVHNTAIKFLTRATDKDQTIEGVDAHVLRATRLMRVFNDQLEAFAKLKGKTSEQKVTVEHVHVYEGGQAIVGAVGTPRGGREMEIEVRPHEWRRGRLKNENPPGDLSAVQSCGARTRRGSPCRCPAMRNGRCRLHGGLSTGPKTPEGRRRIRIALFKHGWYTKQAKQERIELRELLRVNKELLRQLPRGRERRPETGA
jgi:hypothetical protein